MGISVPANARIVDRIRQVQGNAVANELIEIHTSNDRWGFKAEAWVSNANYSVKRTTLLLFINHRSVESSAIKKAVEQTYSAFLPKGGHPFVYLSLDIDPQRVDVNVHPTKREVNFLNEDEIIEIICDEIRTRLGAVDTSRTFMTQSLLPGAKVPTIQTSTTSTGTSATASAGAQSEEPASSRRTPQQKGSTQRPYENNLVRTDSRVRKITTMFLPGPQPVTASGTSESANREEALEYETSDKEPTICRLTTIKDLRAEVRENMHNELTDVFASHTFVGIVDERRRIVAIQGGVKLYLIDYAMVCNEYFYQVGLTDFGNFGFIRFDPALNLSELLTVGVNQEKIMADVDDDIDWDEVVPAVRQQLISRREMLMEYFSLEITDEGELVSIPLLTKGYTPSLAKLPHFLIRLGPHVNWLEEKACFRSFLRELASFYVPEVLPSPPHGNEEGQMDGTGQETPDIMSRRTHLERAIEHVLFPAFRSRLVATKGLLKGVVEVANLKGLYRVFERC